MKKKEIEKKLKKHIKDFVFVKYKEPILKLHPHYIDNHSLTKYEIHNKCCSGCGCDCGCSSSQEHTGVFFSIYKKIVFNCYKCQIEHSYNQQTAEESFVTYLLTETYGLICFILDVEFYHECYLEDNNYNEFIYLDSFNYYCSNPDTEALRWKERIETFLRDKL